MRISARTEKEKSTQKAGKEHRPSPAFDAVYIIYNIVYQLLMG